MQNKFLLSLYFLILYIYTAASTNIAGIGEHSPIVSCLLPVAIGLLVASVCRISIFKRSLLILLGALTVWNIVIYATLERFPSPYPYITLFVAFIAFHAFKNDFTLRYLNTTVTLTSISLVVWLLCLAAPQIMKSVALNFGIPYQDVSYSFVFFNVSNRVGEIWPVRSCGFCWEPGRYACMLIIALFFYFSRYGLNFKNKKFWILTLGVISTFSTTGYAMYFVLITIWGMYSRKLNLLYFIPIAILVAVVWNLPFMGEKITGLIADQDKALGTIDGMMYESQHGSDTYYTPQRFEAILLQWMNFINMPLLTGEGRNLTLHYINRTFGVQLALSEGVLGILVRYGLVLGFFCYLFLYKSSVMFSKLGARTMGLLFMILFVMANISYYFWESPLFVVMWCWYLFSKDVKKPQLIRRYGTKTAYINNNAVLQ